MSLEKIISKLEDVIEELKDLSTTLDTSPIDRPIIIREKKFSYNTEIGEIYTTRGETISLTRLENEFLKYLMVDKKGFAKYEDIITDVFDNIVTENNKRVVQVHRHRISKKIKKVIELKTKMNKGIEVRIL